VLLRESLEEIFLSPGVDFGVGVRGVGEAAHPAPPMPKG
jgi:hypothetical protein